MLRGNRSAAGVGALGAAIVVLLPAWPAVAAAAAECEGQPATIVGTEGPDQISGTAGKDVVVALGGDDVITGVGRLDNFDGDVVCAGDGNDTVSAVGYAVLLGEAGNDTIVVGDGTLSSYATVHGGPGDDELRNDGDRPVYMYGEAGDDEMVGSSAYEHMWPGPGDDVVDGGPDAGLGFGTARLRFDESATAVRVRLRDGTATGEGNDRISNVTDVTGSRFSDALVGDGADNDLLGGPFPPSARDVLVGLGGDDRLTGHGTLFGGPGADTLTFDPAQLVSDDLLDGGADIDLVDYTTAGDGVVVDLTAGTATGAGIGSDRLRGVEDVTGTSYEDTLIGDDQRNVLRSGRGGDTVDGRAGDDILRGGGGHDVLDGGPGVDRLDGGGGRDSCVNGEALRNCES